LEKHEAWDRIRDNDYLKRALEVALVGGHTVMVVGREGDGKELVETIGGKKVLFVEPCPCGNYGHSKVPCICSPRVIVKYRARRSFRRALDADIRIELMPPRALQRFTPEPFSEVERRIRVALGNKLPTTCSECSTGWYSQALAKMDFAEKQQHAIQRVAATIAQMDGSNTVTEVHFAEAMQYQMPR
jgi:magnesium chelatase family protein